MAAKRQTPEVETAAELYGLATEDFVGARDSLAKRLRSGGDRERADEVKALRKPSVPAAAVNRAVRAEPNLAAAVVEAGEELGVAQQEAIEDGDASGLRDAMRGETDAIEALLGAIRSEGELGAGMLDRARDTIRAAARDADLREDFLAGKMARDAEAIGFGGELVQADPPRRATRQGSGGGSRKRATRREAATRKPAKAKPNAVERRRAERAVAKAEAAVEKNERKATEAADALAGLESGVEETSEAVERARRELAAAEKALERAERDRDRGAGRAEKARRELSERREQLDRARAELEGLG
ncbi:hypothetical protein HJD18_02290 [Thermoleophilia bacterium SCSIO 60948]|nr:hypothetical protein HJD18_02290 [Thermoleophilia bacterium SCSIO 60948]